MYKSFIRPHLDYGDVVYDQPSNDVFSNELETAQYSFSKYGSNKRYISQKVVSRIRFRISAAKKMDETSLPILQNCFN